MLYAPVEVQVRDQAISRMLRMNARHATYGWEQRRQRPVAPHAVAFLYADPLHAEGPDAVLIGYQVVAATRMVNAAPEVRDAAKLLHRLTTLATERYVPAPGGFDPVAQLSNNHDRSSGRAIYIGLGVSTLDTRSESWEQVQASVSGPMDIGGRCLLVLSDQTTALIERGSSSSFGRVDIRCTHSLNDNSNLAIRPWMPQPPSEPMPDTDPEVWTQMRALHTLIHTYSRRTL
jgi:hypothetical protein